MKRNEIKLSRAAQQTIANLSSPEVQQQAFDRRFARAEKQNKKRNGIIATLVALALALSVTAVVVISAPRTVEPEQPTEPRVVEVVKTIHDREAWELTEADFDLVVRVVSAMARGEEPLVQRAVAQSIRNAAEKHDMSISEVVEWGKYPVDSSDEIDNACVEAVTRVTEGYNAVDATILYSYNPNVQNGAWHEAQQFVCQLGNLRFFN